MNIYSYKNTNVDLDFDNNTNVHIYQLKLLHTLANETVATRKICCIPPFQIFV